MLNTALVEQFQAIHAERKTGVLKVRIATNSLRYCFNEGELLLLDFGEDKERLMARKFLDYHKIGPEIFRHVVESCTASKSSILEMLRRQQLVNDSEVEHIARTMVEDVLTMCFGIRHQECVFNDQEGPDSFDLDKSAVRLRIQTDVLVRMVEARVKEEEAIHKEVGNWDLVYRLSEGSEPGDLDEFERHVLNFVDGKKSIEDLAVAFRDSSLNMARLLVGLANKGCVAPVAGLSTRRQAANEPRSTSATPKPVPALQPKAEAKGKPEAESEPQPTDAAPEAPPAEAAAIPRRRNNNFAIVAAVVLIILGGVGWLVLRSSQVQQHVTNLVAAVELDIAERNWEGALAHINMAESQAGVDETARARVATLQQRFTEAQEQERKRIEELIEEQNYADARERADHLISTPENDEVRQKLDDLEAEYDDRAAAHEAKVADLIDSGQVAEALAYIKQQNANDAVLAVSHLERWRVSALEKAASAGNSLGERQKLLALIRVAAPTELQMEQVNVLQAELDRSQSRQLEAIKIVKKELEAGNFADADAYIAKVGMTDLADGSAFGKEIGDLRARLVAVKEDLQGSLDKAVKTLQTTNDPETLTTIVKGIAALLAKYPQASNKKSLATTAAAIDAVAPIIARGSLTVEATALAAALEEQKPEKDVVAAIQSRIDKLRLQEAAAQNAIDYVHQIARDGQWDEVTTRLEAILANPAWARATIISAAETDLSEAKANKEKRNSQQAAFDQALTKGDIGMAHQLAQQMGLKYLPLLIESAPAGAEVVRDGAKIGVTPMVLKIDAGDRGNLNLDIRANGFTTAHVTNKDAVEGWHVSINLDRIAVARAAANLVVSNRPTFIDGKVWLASTLELVSVSLSGEVKRYPFESAKADEPAEPLEEPVYAPAAVLDGIVYLGTRDLVAIKAVDGLGKRVALTGRTEFALAAYHSPVIVDRRYLISAGNDGVLRGNDESQPGSGWQSKGGAPFVAAPRLVGDTLLTARADGELAIYQADDGALIKRESVGGPIKACWHDKDGLAGMTVNTAFFWNGGSIVTSALPRDLVDGGPGIIVTIDNRAFIQNAEGEWSDLGRFSGKLSGEPLLWNGHAVLPTGRLLQIVGPQAFSVKTDSEFVSPTLCGDKLAVVTANGGVTIYAP